MQTNVSVLSKVEQFRKGDLNGDGVINFSDFRDFRTAYNAAHGVGAFDQLLAQVPEPGSFALIAVLGSAWMGVRRRRGSALALSVVICLFVAHAARAVDLLDVDVNARSNPANMPAGYSSFTLSNSGSQANGTAVVNGYTITVTAVNAAGTPQGALDDRVRTTPVSSPTLTLYQIYQDFIFAGTTVGAGGGLNLQISGGQLQPNSQYTFSLYSFDSGSTGAHTVTWSDGNNGNALVANTSFNGATLPTTDAQYKYSGLATTDASGQLFLKSRSTNGGAINNSFLNGFEIALPIELTLEINTVSGATRILNQQTASFNASYYEIRSSGGSLNLAGWSSLDDAEPNPDPVGTGWDKVPASNANLLSEVNLTSMSTFAPGSTTSLGNAFTVGGVRDVTFQYAAPNETNLRSGIVRYVTTPVGVSGDYNGNGVVDAADYVLWRKGGPLQNDSTPGVGPEDYTFWRSRFGATSGSGTSLDAGAVPEPVSIGLLLLGVLSIAGRRGIRN